VQRIFICRLCFRPCGRKSFFSY